MLGTIEAVFGIVTLRRSVLRDIVRRRLCGNSVPEVYILIFGTDGGPSSNLSFWINLRQLMKAKIKIKL